ncbi:phage/plasmid primase, P4 family [Providencia sneebia]|uniref:p4 family phage/plasmid primase n=1 Tax=Providencia sneebia DSM 19967 TaxID=1141660 RepID=K8WHV0_9GAMM|nr:P4 family phage/plasmid primase [Providencia sneebia DSM 19967]
MLQYDFNSLNNNYPIYDVFTKLTDISISPCGSDTLEPEDETCPFCGHKNAFRFHADSNQYHCYSCEEHGGVLDLIQKVLGLRSVFEAARYLSRMSSEIPSVTPIEIVEEDNRDHNVISSVFMDIALHYAKNLVDEALNYQVEQRGHSQLLLEQHHIGIADGQCYATLSGKYDDKTLLATGMFREVNGRIIDFVPEGVYVYPHFDNGRIVRFTFKDPKKTFKYQQPKKYWLPEAHWYGQQTLEKPGTIALVEGENDALTLIEAGYTGPVLASIGSLSQSQVDYINSLRRSINTYFDNDDAGDRYRSKFPSATHYIVPERGSDIDEFIREGGDWQALEAEQTFIPLIETPVSNLPNSCGAEGFNDVGNANRLARLFGHNLRYVRETDSFIHFVDNQWKPASVQVMEYAKQVAADMLAEGHKVLADDDTKGTQLIKAAIQLHNLPKLKAMIELVKPKLEVCMVDLDADPMLLGVGNGVIDLNTGEYRENRRLNLITRYTPVDFNPNAKCPTWERFINDITVGDTELASFLQRLVGYFLAGRTDEQLLFFFYGHGSNGKSTFIQIIQSLMGSYATQINSDVLMMNKNSGGPNASLAKLPGKRLVVANELPENGRLDDTLIKSMTGGDIIVARQVYGKHELEFYSQFSLVIIGNHKPAIYDMSHGMWRRMCLIPFAANFTAAQIDPELPVKLGKELQGILNWALEGVQAWHAEGLKRSLPAAVIAANDEYRQESDLIGEFLEGCLQEPDAYTAASELYQAFLSFANEGNEWRMTQRIFTKKMVERGFEKVRRNNKAGFRGIALLDPDLAPLSTHKVINPIFVV